MNGKFTKSVAAVATALLVCVSVFAGIRFADTDRNMPTNEQSTQVQVQQKPETEQPQISEEPEEVVVENSNASAVPVIKTQNTTAANSSTTVQNSTKPDKNNGSASDKNQNNNGAGNNQQPVIPDVAVTESIVGLVNSDSTLAQAVSLTSEEGVQATVPAGVKVAKGAQQLTLTVITKEDTDSNVKPEGTEKLDAYDVHIEGIAKDNTTPVAINLGEVLPTGLNKGNLALYHVENGQTVTMTEVGDAADFSAHNQFAYSPENGEVSVAITGFSEIALISNAEEGWKGNFDYSWYTNAVAAADGEAVTEYRIANADQLAAFGAIVGGMAEGIERDSFEGKTVKLVNDINIGDDEDNNKSDVIFYPIGYYNSTKSYKKVSDDSVSSTVYSFEGTFDGNGHTISNFYQNTWEMFGDYNSGYSGTPNYYKDAMGLFGYVVNGTVKNLTVDNFSSDGEFTPTGVIAAYAVNSTFENIAITNCNPRVYNTGNGGIIGVAGRENAAEEAITLKNITVDNSNKISALWGSYDVACGGLVGMFRGNVDAGGKPTGDTINFDNCHVSAQIDVYNDVCGNYQYYAYRYAGMIIGSVRHNEEKDGKTIPAMAGISAEGCTVNYGNWNDYYYCEFEKNGHPSYAGPDDYKFSRVDNSEIIFNEEGKAIGCNHEHTDVEDNRAIYLPFHQLFTGYSWGVSSIGLEKYSGIVTDLDITEGDQEESVVKFEKADNVAEFYTTGKTVTIGELFEAKSDAGVDIDADNVQVTVSPADENSTVTAVYTPNTTDWTQGTLTFTGLGKATITITDYYFCTPTTIEVEIVRKDEVKFANKFTGEFLYRVGNAANSPVELKSLFAEDENKKFDVIGKDVNVTIETVAGNASGTFTANTTNWTKGTIQFTGTGVVKVAITDNDYCTPTVITLEVVDAVNATTATSATAGEGETNNNVVLLNDAGLSSLTVSGRYTFYGNGFTLTYTGNGQYLNNGLKQGIVTVSENGTLDNLRIKASIYPNAYMYYGSTLLGDYVQGGPSSTEGDRTRYHYQLSAVAASGNATISNCYIYGGRNNIFVNTGDVTIRDSILECGTVANVQIQSNASHTITFEDVTTIQYQVHPTVGSDADKAKVMLGAGVLVGPETTENPEIVLNGEFKQYNWVTADDANAVSDTKITKAIIQGALDATAYNHTVNGKTASNLGIIYMNTYGAEVENNTRLPYELGNVSIKMSGNSVNGQVYSLQDATAEQINSDYVNADKTTVNGVYQPQFKYPADLGEQYIEKDSGDEHCYREGDTIHVMFPSGDTKELDLAKLVNIEKYNGQNLGLEITCKDENGNDVAVTNGKISLSEAGTYTVTYTVTDKVFYDKDGNQLEINEVSRATTVDEKEYSWNVTISVSLKDTAIPNAYFEFDASKQKMGYYKPTFGDVKQYLPFLAGLKIYDYNGQTSYLRFDGSTDFNKVASVTITGYESNKAFVEIKLTDGGVIHTRFLSRANSGGGSTYTGKIKTSNNTIYFVTDSGTSDKDTTTTAAYWNVDYYKFIGNNGVEITSGQQTFNSTGSSASTPSGSFGTTIKYTVNYDANGGNCAQTTGYATSAATAVTLPTAKRSGYIFAGWYTAASGGTRVGGAGDSYTPSANVTLYAQWGKPCTVTYDANGGSCGTASEKYTGTALTLPTPKKDGQVFTGWYTAVEGGEKVGYAEEEYNPKTDITLYAQWANPATVTYNANGGTCGIASEEYKGKEVTLPTPTFTGYKFLGWYDAKEGGNKIGDAGASYTPNENITLYAQWEHTIYTITINKQSNATVTVDKTSAYYGDTVSVTVSFSKNNSKTLKVKDASGDTILSKDAAGTYTFTMPASNITIEASSSGTCVTPDTLVTMADGTQKEIQYVNIGEEIVTWDFYAGEYTTRPVVLVQVDGEEIMDVLHLNFSDGTTLKVLGEHGIFDADLNNFIFIDIDDVDNYIGHNFVKKSGDGYETVELVDYTITTEHVKAYTILAAEHYNVILDGMFTNTPAHVGGNFFNPFEIHEGLKYDLDEVARDIETYGLYTYEDFAHVLTEEQFNVLNLAPFKVAVGKGIVTYDGLIYLIENFIHSPATTMLMDYDFDQISAYCLETPAVEEQTAEPVQTEAVSEEQSEETTAVAEELSDVTAEASETEAEETVVETEEETSEVAEISATEESAE